jgi:signal transduction histidine kinase
MIFGRKLATVAAPASEPATNGSGTVSLRELEARLDAHDDEFRYMKQRFQTLQARIMSELRELRRLVDSYEPVEDEELDEEG